MILQLANTTNHGHSRLHVSALLTHIILHRAHTHIQHLHMPLPFQPTLCALSFSLSSSHVSKLLKHLPAVTSRALVPATFQYISLSAGGRKKRTKIQKARVVISSFCTRVFSSLAACPLTLTAAQTHTGLHLASVETGRQPLRRL